MAESVMTQSTFTACYILKGLACSSCGIKIERAVARLPYVAEAELNFATGKITVKSNSRKIKEMTDTISFNPCTVQKRTYVEYLWKQRKYRPPWLFSIVKILKESKKIVGNKVRIKIDVTGGGKIRGAHNCRDCDKKYLKAISDFSLNQDIKIFGNLNCLCYEKWKDQLELEGLGYGSLVNMYG